VVGAGYKLGGRPLPITSPPPALGEHTESVLLAEGFGADEIARLRQEDAL
jgi:crotonobetainyl-CoA:carnitine CoA-transferase CaiB-like acyl-CoA transferase